MVNESKAKFIGEITLDRGKRTVNKEGAERFIPNSFYTDFPLLSSSELDIFRVNKEDFIVLSGDVVPQFCGKSYPVIVHKLTSDMEAAPICRLESIKKSYMS